MEIKEYVCFDLETTGKNSCECDIIEIAAIKVKNGVIIDKYQSYVKTNHFIPCDVVKLTGITQDIVNNARQLSEILDDFITFISDDIIIGHNIATFDIPVLKRFCFANNIVLKNRYIDTYYLSRKALPGLESHSLPHMCEYYNITNKKAHSAYYDVEATDKIFRLLYAQYNDLIYANPITEYIPTPKKHTAESRLINELNTCLHVPATHMRQTKYQTPKSLTCFLMQLRLYILTVFLGVAQNI